MNLRHSIRTAVLALCLSPFIPAFAWDGAAPSSLSAVRHAHESATQAKQRTLGPSVHDSAPYPSPGNVDVLADAAGLAAAAAAIIPWEGTVEDFNRQVFATRHDRFLDWQLDGLPPVLKRRTSWQYPYDGCFARAETFNRNLADAHAQHKLQKIYVFGDLAAQTDNSPEGLVRWWYHVAPVTRIGQEVFVVDPALHSGQPIALEHWLQQVVNAAPDPVAERAKLTISVCDAASFAPYQQLCNGSDGYDPTRVENYVRRFLDREWDNEIALGRDPAETLLSD